ncbi:hypothetical protein ZOD2009_05237 [Haladaptatus paucihalophilus DX253]|uniref:Short C-terminal domain-containing protein n=1 Tax=Haladaptatus paucihalophilus DX253 TaxID=797209 RepID=E7QQH7_HALPU|nr:SHOCT domain-containing protein [Haladaptatus paucihalophilus]EFW93241.1 hypothetical protein ZOD2009_05237 [Haladaptatus paucihalophilus DX253]SHK48995.1 Short C-terminal domain-containing protein [Haladaptatus paucihalophilus DX253]
MADSGVRILLDSFVLGALLLASLGFIAFLKGNLLFAVSLWAIVVFAAVLHVSLDPEMHETDDSSSSPMRDDSDTTPTVSTDDALSTLRRRYADGEVSEAQFERGVERLLTVESNRDEAVVALRNRYARGELTDEQFDRKFERLCATRTVENAEESVERGEFASENE